MPEQIVPLTITQATAEFPLSITILSYVGVVLLALILIVLVRISGKISTVAHRLRKMGSHSEKSSSTSRDASSDDETEAQTVEAGPGSPFEEFLNEDPKHRTLPKKDQFKAYRKWRAEKGLNWSK
ncbi:MAG: hypothetical protein IZT59_00550 [Verrucomicrobia bacterium]|jgi:hypothetical protein|nr:hypothetical protein [Verrucomicrobiota bacterium]|tara:strand:+ start:7884 stop:8258 length:375 start_codon:yes stop_codon:yes gene_type:complete